jgi:hypothetical protein
MKSLKSSCLWILWIATLLVGALGACVTIAPAPTPSYTCDTYCDNALRLGCSFAQPAPGNDATCADVCRSATSVVRWDLGCRSTSQTCEQIDACERRGTP